MKEIIPEMTVDGGCGPAALSFAVKRFGINISEMELARRIGTTPENGTSWENMIKGARDLGLEAEAYTDKSLDELQELHKKGKEIILDWMTSSEDNPLCKIEEDGHYSVMDKSTNQYVVLNDSIWGTLVLMKRDKFEKQWYDYDVNKNDKVYHWALVIGGKMS
jgi:predicted double-glycine peptidase